MKKACGDCTICCTGILHHEVYGQKVGSGVDCRFISTSDEKCAIYEFRPDHCVGYKCNWLVIDEWPDELRPDLSGVLSYTNRKRGHHVIYTEKSTEFAKNYVKNYFESKNQTFKKIIYINPIK